MKGGFGEEHMQGGKNGQSMEVSVRERGMRNRGRNRKEGAQSAM